MIRRLGHYYYNSNTKEVVLIAYAYQPLVDNIKSKNFFLNLSKSKTYYSLKSNQTLNTRWVGSDDKTFWYTFKRISALKAKLLW